ncbi:PREDICTED: putative F-box/FBD/LRR-repeat protein At4g13965 [Fragaria vesca subsp. vesca]|uniref:putative F-box/FBD/LRR-repeat protein At4g13965 n=1 Tax=Fragaria vesca subsp. vesca TaxID=101020 RepID=UPI0002C37235|nr:PREDICTED: putative F-box/FBD/LRR-repeat protein At4g13965 [Fragaria vesca subsp. vesca]
MDSESKRQVQGVDRISALPDALVCHILSFIPTVYAVWTTLLSRRWNNLWRSLPNLDFNNEDFPTKRTDDFMEFVDCVLASRGSTDIRKLSLHIRHCENFSTGDFYRVHRWICAATRENLVELDFCLLFESRQNDELELPLSLFKCKTLEVLSVQSNCITYPAATKGCFPSLKVLDVSDFRPDVDSMQKFFSHFPVLEELNIYAYPCFYNVFNIKVSAPELKTLRISLDYFSHNYMRPNNIFINAPKLENLEVTDGVLTNYSLESTRCPERTKIVYSNRRLNNDYWFIQDKDDVFEDEAPRFTIRAAALLEKVQNVKCLSLESRPKCLEACCVPALEYLVKLELALLDCYNWELLTELLKRSPKLEYLGLEHKKTSFHESLEREWNPPESVPICLASSLKTICVNGFKGRRYEMEVAKYLLNHGEVLNTMTISTKDQFGCQDGRPYKTEEELCKEFHACQKGSKICRVNIIYDAGFFSFEKFSS